LSTCKRCLGLHAENVQQCNNLHDAASCSYYVIMCQKELIVACLIKVIHKKEIGETILFAKENKKIRLFANSPFNQRFSFDFAYVQRLHLIYSVHTQILRSQCTLLYRMQTARYDL